MSNNNILVDGLNLAHRAMNANLELQTTTGLKSGLFYGFLRSAVALKKRYSTYKLSVVWDGSSRRRREAYPLYKSGRPESGADLSGQVFDLRELLSSIGVTQYLNPDQEADDVMASLSEHFKGLRGHTVLYTNDRDLLQMVEDGKVSVHKPKVGMSQEVIYDEEKVKGYFGVPPKLLVCYRSFDGDASDNLPGVSRVPRKLIATLVEKYGSVQDIYMAIGAEKLTDFQRGSMLEGRGSVERNNALMALDRNLDSVGEIRPTQKVEEADKLLSKYEIRSYTGESLTDVFGTIFSVRTGVMEPLKLENYSLF